jgi:hypothetical protein
MNNRPPVQPSHNQCHYCKKSFGLFGGSSRSKESHNFCKNCFDILAPNSRRFLNALSQELSLSNVSVHGVAEKISNVSSQFRVDPKIAMHVYPELCEAIVNRYWAFMLSDSVLSEIEQRDFERLLKLFDVSNSFSHKFVGQIYHHALRRDLNQGKLPIVRTSIVLNPSETAHLDTRATYVKEMARSVSHVPGQLIITSNRVLFVDSVSPFEASLSKVSNIHPTGPHSIFISLTKRQGTGNYFVDDPVVFTEIARKVLEKHNRIQVVSQSATRAIPQSMKAAVWQRDQGRCVQCGESRSLEFDHIIPFSKGGATSEANLQLLCRDCNLKKGARL